MPATPWPPLLANGVDIVGRSYSRRAAPSRRRRRGSAILQIGSREATQIPNVRATQQALYGGLASSTNGWPNVQNDLMGIFGKVGGKLMPPGFYYKTFMYPQSMWMTYEKYIRKAAGLGRAPTEVDPDSYDWMNHHCDVLVVGAGPAGLAAALAARSGARVILADEQEEFGGSLLDTRETLDGKPAAEWVADAVAELQGLPEVILLPRSTVNGYHDHNFLTIHERRTDHLGEVAPLGQVRQRVHRVRAKRVVLAGAHERPLVYGNNDLPGNMLAGAVSTYVRRYGVAPGKKLVLATNNDYAYRVALDWQEAGLQVVAIADARANPRGEWVEEARQRGMRVITGSSVIEARGGKRVSGAKVARIDLQAMRASGGEWLDCDLIASSGGYSPVVHLASHLGGKPEWREEILAFVPGEGLQKRICAGAVNGVFGLAEVLADGYQAGSRAALDAGYKTAAGSLPKVQPRREEAPVALFQVPHEAHGARAEAVRRSAERRHRRRHRTGLPRGLRVHRARQALHRAGLRHRPGQAGQHQRPGDRRAGPGQEHRRHRHHHVPSELHPGDLRRRRRPPLRAPVRTGALHRPARLAREERRRVRRRRPVEAAVVLPAPRRDMHAAVARECRAVREAVGLLDASTLGKIDIQGPDAREFLNRVYTNAWTKLDVGKARYGLMCKEDGMVFDDGVTACLADNHFVMTTTTGGAARVLEWLELYHQTEWPERRCTSPRSPTTTRPSPCPARTAASCSPKSHRPGQGRLTWKEGKVRISFTGELSYEVNVQADYAMGVLEALAEHGAKYGLTPYGTETMHVLRAEKGFIIVGQDTDASVTPDDLNMGWAVGRSKPFSWIGWRGMNRTDCLREDRKQLVGLRPSNPQEVLPEGAQLVFDTQQAIPMKMVGHVTSSYMSASLGHGFALAVVKGGLKRMGQKVYAPLADGRFIEAEICSSVFYDPKGERQNVD